MVFNVIITFKPKSRFHSVKAFSLFANFYHKRVAKCQTQSLKISRNDAREYVVSIAHWYNLSSVPSDLGLQLYSLGLWPKVVMVFECLVLSRPGLGAGMGGNCLHIESYFKGGGLILR